MEIDEEVLVLSIPLIHNKYTHKYMYTYIHTYMNTYICVYNLTGNIRIFLGLYNNSNKVMKIVLFYNCH